LEHHQQQEHELFPRNLEENFHGLVHHHHHVNNHSHNAVQVSFPNFQEENKVHHEGKKRKILDFQETSSANSTPAVSESGSKTKHVNIFFYYFFFFIFFFMFFCDEIIKFFFSD
jgi:microcystin-dependent protein